MAAFEIALFGSFKACYNRQPLPGFRYDKVRALLAYLAAESAHPQGREALATLLWPDWPQQSALRNLSYALVDLRNNIGDKEAKPPFLLITRDTLQLRFPGGTLSRSGAELSDLPG